MTQSLGGKSVLIVDDEVIFGMTLFDEIARVGGTSIGPVTSVAGALKEIESRTVHAVILDAKLADGSGADLAACLEERRIPYVVVSGYEKASLPRGLRGAPFVAKPVSLPLLMEAIEGLNAGPGGDVAGSACAKTGDVEILQPAFITAPKMDGR